MPPVFQTRGTSGALSYYDTTPLRETLSELIDFKLINNGGPRLSVGAVHIKTGNIIYFDSAAREIRVEHIMASGALPPGFPPVIVDGEAYWDGGIVSNTPLQYRVRRRRKSSEDMCIFQVDLFPAPEAMSRNHLRCLPPREGNPLFQPHPIQHQLGQRHLRLHMAARRLAAKLPEALRDDPGCSNSDRKGRGWLDFNHPSHPPATSNRNPVEGFEFSRLSMNEHWEAGSQDVECTFDHEDWKKRVKPREGIAVYDLTCPVG